MGREDIFLIKDKRLEKIKYFSGKAATVLRCT
jgi:hypothetical protein